MKYVSILALGLLASQPALAQSNNWGVSASVDAWADGNTLQWGIDQSCSGPILQVQQVCSGTPPPNATDVTRTTSLTATSALASKAVSSVRTQPRVPPPGIASGTWSGTGMSSGSLSTGQMRWMSSADLTGDRVIGNARGIATVEMYDEITFTPESFLGQSRLTFGVTADLDGTFRNATISLLMQAQSSIDNFLGSFALGSAPNDYTTTYDVDSPGRFVRNIAAGDWLASGPSSYHALITVSALSPKVSFRFYGAGTAATLAGMNSFVDLGNTARIGLALPPGALFSSASGVFLTESTPAPGVPEPAAWAMMIFGFGLIGAMQRRRVPQGAAPEGSSAPCIRAGGTRSA